MPIKPSFAKLGQCLRREPRLAVPLGGVRREQVLRHVARRVAQQALLLAQASFDDLVDAGEK